MSTTITTPGELPARLMKPKQAADWLQVSDRTLRTLTKAGKIPAVRVGKQTRFDPDDLRRYVDGSKTRPVVHPPEEAE